MSVPSPIACSIKRAPSSMSNTTIGNGATNGAGIVWLTTNVCTPPWRASAPGTDDRDGPRRVERGDTAEQRGGRTRVADRAVNRARRRDRRAHIARQHGAEPAVGVGQRPRAYVERGERLGDIAHDREENLF